MRKGIVYRKNNPAAASFREKEGNQPEGEMGRKLEMNDIPAAGCLPLPACRYRKEPQIPVDSGKQARMGDPSPAEFDYACAGCRDLFLVDEVVGAKESQVRLNGSQRRYELSHVQSRAAGRLGNMDEYSAALSGAHILLVLGLENKIMTRLP